MTYMKDMHGSVVDLSVYLNEGYDENVNWHDWDAGAYGADVGNVNYGFAALEVYDVEASLWGAGMLYKIQGRSNDLWTYSYGDDQEDTSLICIGLLLREGY